MASVILPGEFGIPLHLHRNRSDERFYSGPMNTSSYLRRYLEESCRTPQRRWTAYFISLLSGRHSVAEIKLLDLSPYSWGKFRSLMTRFRDHDRKLYLRSFGGSSLFAFVTAIAFYLIFFRVMVNVFKVVSAHTASRGPTPHLPSNNMVHKRVLFLSFENELHITLEY